MQYTYSMQSKKLVFVFLFCIIVLSAFLRFWHIPDAPPGLYHDEAINGANALEALHTGTYKLFYPENNGREGLYINMLALSLALFGNEPWAIRIVSALFGTLTALGLYFLTRELFYDTHNQRSIFRFQGWKWSQWKPAIENHTAVALLSAFFIASSFWHIMFSRIGFRGILAPFFLVWSFYFLYRTLRAIREQADEKRIVAFAVIGGIFFGLGFHTYIPYRLAPLLLIPPFLSGWRFYKTKAGNSACAPCMLALFLFAAFVAAAPMGYYFLQNPADFAGRSAQISAFATEHPLTVIGKNTAQTIGMFFWNGDYNWRHNVAGKPLLWWPVGMAFLIGILQALRKRGSAELFLLLWLAVMALPAIVSSEGIPHALRTIGMIPPVMILSAAGFLWLVDLTQTRINKWLASWPEKEKQIKRIGAELSIIFIIVLAGIPVYAGRTYFTYWVPHTETRSAFNEEIAALGYLLRELPGDMPKYVIVQASGVLVRGIPMPAQSAMFIADGEIAARGVPTRSMITYILPEDEYILENRSEPFISVFIK
jgi:4-amino-4-deoxy-L-arabinose transferase-like glycosyltransferase